MVYIGLDISHTYFDAALPQGKNSRKFDNQLSGFEALAAVLPADSHCVIEAGPYYLRLASYLYQRGIPVSVVNPLVIKRPR